VKLPSELLEEVDRMRWVASFTINLPQLLQWLRNQTKNDIIHTVQLHGFLDNSNHNICLAEGRFLLWQWGIGNMMTKRLKSSKSELIYQTHNSVAFFTGGYFALPPARFEHSESFSCSVSLEFSPSYLLPEPLEVYSAWINHWRWIVEIVSQPHRLLQRPRLH